MKKLIILLVVVVLGIFAGIGIAKIFLNAL